MPADADYLCEYFISSSFGSKSKLNTTSSSSLNSLLSTGPSSASNTSTSAQKSTDSSNSAQSSSYLETIEFAKYDKDKMEYLKSKYSTLSDQNTKKPVATTNGLTSPAASNNKDTTTMSTVGGGSKLDLNWSRIRRIGIGLLNLGNNCYLNATLQCLAYTPPLSQWLVQRPHSPGCKFKQVKGFCSLCEVERIIYELFHGHGFAKPNSLCFNIKKISHVFGVGTQEDASEFFTTLLESMAKSIKYGQQQQQSNKKTVTVLDEIFSFQFRSRITCGNCGRLSDTVENTNSWPIDVKYTQELSKGIAHFLREEVLDGENAYKCDKCNRKVRATKKYSVRTAPNILVIQLKRFDFSYAGKLSHFVSYPETLTLKTLLPSSSSEAVGQSPAAQAALHAMADSASSSPTSEKSALRSVSYKLYGVLVHLGHTSHSGHYYSYVRAPNDTWYKADDQRVNVVQQNEALRQNAYILFYSKVTSGAVETASAVTAMSNVTLPRPLVTAGVNTQQQNSTHFKLNNSPSQPTKPQSYIPQVIRETSVAASKPNHLTPSNYLNSLTSPSSTAATSSGSLLLRPDHEKVVFKLKNSLSTTSVAKPVTTNVELPVTSLASSSTDQQVDKKSSKLVDKVKKVKRLIKKQRQTIKSQPDLPGEEKKEKWAKLKMLKKKLKKLVKRKEERKAKKNQGKEKKTDQDLEQHSSRKRSIESSDEKKNKKRKHSQDKDDDEPLNGLALLKQYDSSPSPTRSSRSPSLTSLSSMSSASANLNQLSSSSSASPVKTTSSPPGTLYSYNPKSKIPDVVTSNRQQSPPKTTSTTQSPLEQMKEKSSLSQLKTWSSDTTSSLKTSQHSTTDDYTEYNEDDAYNEDFDRPMSRNQGMSKFNSKKPDYSGFHLYTHGNQNPGGQQYNKYNNYNKKPYYNGNGSNNYQNGGGSGAGGKWNGQQRFNNYHNGNNNNNRFHYNKNGRGGGGGYRGGGGGKGGVFNAFHHQR